MVGAIVGALVTGITLTLFSGLLFISAERQLIEDWRKIQPGMERTTVEQILGAPSYDFEIGQGFGPWPHDSLPADYDSNHGLLVFVTGLPGPQVLLVYMDEKNCVSFVSSTTT